MHAPAIDGSWVGNGSSVPQAGWAGAVQVEIQAAPTEGENSEEETDTRKIPFAVAGTQANGARCDRRQRLLQAPLKRH